MRYPKKREEKYKVNEQIRVREALIIDENGNNLGVMPVKKALELARERDLDLVQVADGKKVVCRIMDYGKFKYQQKKKQQEAKKKQKQIEIKEIKLRPSTDKHDLEVKIKHIREFLEEGKKVKVTVVFR
ncbi:MAG TPA: translation initiation factor IF-3 [Aquificae bacterium]|nr:translation initiation factor IF-3 [Aquificota bacterium]